MPMTHPAKPDANNANRYARYGLSLPQQALRALEKRGIYCQPGVSIEHQHLARRYVLRGIESGGAVADMGRYCAYLEADGSPVPWLQQIDSISGNGRHAIVIVPELVRIEMLRISHTYELAITRLWLKSEEGHTRPAIATAPIFRGHQGMLAVELWNAASRTLCGTVAPAFYTAAGEVLDLPKLFEEAIRKITGAVACLGCKHTHIAVAPATNKGGER
jgi:hypothetical protein